MTANGTGGGGATLGGMRHLLMLAGLLICVPRVEATPLRHYVFFNVDRQRIRDTAFLTNPAFEGAQIKYTWRQLEPAKDRYDFRPIREDLRWLRAHKKKLFIQLQDVSFYESIVNVPEYLRQDPVYNGGAHRTVEDEAKGVSGGWVARRWDPAVRERFHKLLGALGREFDGRIEGINLPETAISFGETGRHFPPGYTHAAYRDAVLETMTALKRSFPRSVAMVYGNFMPGEWLPGGDAGYLRSIYEHARKIGVAVGGPDLLPNRRWQINHSYNMIRDRPGTVPGGIAVQEGNYAYVNPVTRARVTVAELIDFATNYLKVDYVFWFPEEPYFTRDVLPFLARARTGAAGPQRKFSTIIRSSADASMRVKKMVRPSGVAVSPEVTSPRLWARVVD